MRLSARITEIMPGGDDGWGIYYAARRRLAQGRQVVNLTIGDHDVGPDAGILAALERSLRDGHTGYAAVEGTLGLRSAIAQAQPVATTPEEVAVTCGGQAGLFAALTTVLDPGDSCVVLDPYYATYGQTVRAVGGEPIVVSCAPDDGFQPDIDAIARALTPRTRAILLNTPNNPSGAVYTADRLAGIAALAEARDLVVVSDEVYAEHVFVGRHLSPRAVPALEGRTLVVNSLSKSHGLTGFRLGWVVGPAEAIARIHELAVTTTYGLPGFVQDAGEHALRHAAGAVEDIRARYAARRRVAVAAFAGSEAARPVVPEGGMYVLVDIRPTGLSGTAFAERLLEAEGIAVMPGESFGAAASGHVRVALTVPEAVLGPALAGLKAFAARQYTARNAPAAR
ncbi:MAG: pyridoxal phosphate-dependent aminotransferase [Pikeienuella sp.]